MRKTIKKYQFTYSQHQNGESALFWKHLNFCFAPERSQGIKKDLKWRNLKSLDLEIELPGRDSNLRPIG